MLFLLNKAIHANWGPSPKLSRWMFVGLVRPMLSYAALNWGHCLSTKKTMVAINKVNRLALLLITQCAPSVPTKGLEVIYGIQPLEIFIQRTALASYFRLFNCYEETWGGQGMGKRYTIGHRLYWKTLARAWGV